MAIYVLAAMKRMSNMKEREKSCELNIANNAGCQVTWIHEF